jgi:hypothetical protein
MSRLSKTKSESESFMILFYGNPLNSACGCTQTVVIVVVVTKNVRMSKCLKAELVAYGICKEPLPSFAYLLPLEPDYSSVCPICQENFQHIILTSKSHNYQTMYQNRPYE